MEKSGLKILIVDDESEIVTAFAKMVQEWGYTALTANSADEAIEILKNEHQRTIMIFSDYKMPGKNGLEFRQEILGHYRSIPFCIVSGYVTREMALSGVEMKICGFVSKPYNEDEILRLFEKESRERIEEIEFEVELREIYLEESTELIQEVEPLLLSLEENPSNMDLVNAIYRLIHTIKGGCNVLENEGIAVFLHHYEDLYSGIKSGKIEANSNVISVLLRGFDKVNTIFSTIVSGSEFTESKKSLLKLLKIDSNTARTDTANSSPDEKNTTEDQKGSNKKKKKEVLSVPMAMLDEFMAQSGEITVIRNMVNKLVLKISKELPASKSVQHLEELLEEMHKINTIMQTKLTEIRKVPLSNVYRPVPRTVRDLCKSIGKEVKLEVEGDELRVDTLISQVLNNCVIHMVRNSIDHGIESPDVRTSRGKKREGTLKISSQESGENIIVHISDDGGGIDAERIKKKIIEREMLSAAEAQALSNEETYQYLFEAGLSTAEKITDVSGRGVGMDMVKTSIESLGGRIDVKSELGVGTTFSLNMPIPKSVQIINALIVTVDGFELSIPQDKVSRLIILEKEKFDGMIWATEGGEMLGIDGELLCIVDARSVLGLRANPHLDARHFVLAKTEDNHSYAIEVDGILDNESIVVKDMETCISDLGLFFGATFLASGQVGLILDVEGFAKHAGLDFKKASEKKPLKLESSQLAKETIDYISVTLHCNGKFAIPLNSVFRFERIAKSEIQVSGERKVVTYRDSIMPIVNLTQVLDLNRNEEEWSDENMSTIVIQSESQLFGFVIKSIEDVHHVSDDIRSLLKNRVGLLGNLIIAGRTHAVIDVNAIIEKFKISSRVAAKRA